MTKFTAFGIDGCIIFPHSIHLFFSGLFRGILPPDFTSAVTVKLKVLFSPNIRHFS
jgi:hypothetical protein